LKGPRTGLIMNRESMLQSFRSYKKKWDIIIIGGGATGLGTAVDAASRGFKTLLLEAHDFAKGTSSRSTKLAHGGVRYLQQGDVSLVFEALKERGIMLHNSPHLVKNLSFVIPSYEWWVSPFYAIGLKVYDMMAGKLGLGKSKHLTKEETLEHLPNIEQEGLNGGVIYQDGQFDDARMAISLARTAARHGCTLMNYMKVEGLLKENDIICGLKARDFESGEEHLIHSKVVINATGVFSDEILKMEDENVREMIKPSQGTHLVVDESFLPGKKAIMVPHTSDGRVMFAVPWYNRVVLGTTDTLVDKATLEPMAKEEEIQFIIDTAGQYLVKQPKHEDILSVFSGLRPLAAPEEGEIKATKEISRHHKILITTSGLLTIIGGKWTTYRKMAEDAVDNAIMIGALPERTCITENLPIHGYSQNTIAGESPMSVYGVEVEKVEAIENENELFEGFLSKKLRIKKVQVIWAVRYEMARTVEDLLSRRTRALFLDARESMQIAEETAKLMALEMNYNPEWVAAQVMEFNELAKGYLLKP
jgi:glycerol-3-phosphate dehydrogenase